MHSARANAALLLTSLLVLATGCLTARSRGASDLLPKPCSYHVSHTRNVPTMSSMGARYRAVITAMVTDSVGKPLASATIARMPGGPGAYTDTNGKAMFHLSERDVERTDSTNVMVRRIGSTAIAVPVRVAAGDSIDIVASMCPWSYGRFNPNARPPMGPEHDHSGIGAGIGAVVGTLLGYFSERGSCDLVASRCTGVHGAAGGAVVGALVGYGIGDLFKSHSACMPADAHSTEMISSVRAIVDTSDVDYRDVRERWKIQGVPRAQVYLVTDERVCRRARQALDSLIHKYSPNAPGLKRFPSVYVVRAGNIVDVVTPGSYAVNLFDATTLRFIGALIQPD